MTGKQFKAAREALGLTQLQAAMAFNLGPYGRKSIGRWEKEYSIVPGPAQVAMRFMLRDAGIILSD